MYSEKYICLLFNIISYFSVEKKSLNAKNNLIRMLLSQTKPILKVYIILLKNEKNNILLAFEMYFLFLVQLFFFIFTSIK